jgi:uncharacterized protein
MINCEAIIKKYYSEESTLYNILVIHVQKVKNKALEIAKRLNNPSLNIPFIEEGALLHDIGIIKTFAPDIGCNGEYPYICHGILGREILEMEGLPKHALVCERHTGTGLTIEDITREHLPLPKRDMLPISLEEQIICYADKFYSKNPKKLHKEKSIDDIRRELKKFGSSKLEQFDLWLKLFGN